MLKPEIVIREVKPKITCKEKMDLGYEFWFPLSLPLKTFLQYTLKSQLHISGVAINKVKVSP